jgi:hypothetical protein
LFLLLLLLLMLRLPLLPPPPPCQGGVGVLPAPKPPPPIPPGGRFPWFRELIPPDVQYTEPSFLCATVGCPCPRVRAATTLGRRRRFDSCVGRSKPVDEVFRPAQQRLFVEVGGVVSQSTMLMFVWCRFEKARLNFVRYLAAGIINVPEIYPRPRSRSTLKFKP